MDASGSLLVPIAYDNNTDPRYPTFRTLDGINPANPAHYVLSKSVSGPLIRRTGSGGCHRCENAIGQRRAPNGMEIRTCPRWRHKTFDSTPPVWTPKARSGCRRILTGHRRSTTTIFTTSVRGSACSVAKSLASGSGTISDDAAADASSTSDDNEDVYAGHGQYSARFGKLAYSRGCAWSPRTRPIAGISITTTSTPIRRRPSPIRIPTPFRPSRADTTCATSW